MFQLYGADRYGCRLHGTFILGKKSTSGKQWDSREEGKGKDKKETEWSWESSGTEHCLEKGTKEPTWEDCTLTFLEYSIDGEADHLFLRKKNSKLGHS